jgi:glycosyltransferase involved in cell wall biosynthesis
MFVEGGVPAAKLVVKPNFVSPDPGVGTGSGGYALYVGRLSAEKGVQTLLNAWRLLPRSVPLRIVGDGPMARDVAAAAQDVMSITWLGRRDPKEIASLLRDARCLVFPSECYETFGRVLIEAFATGTPVIAAGHGAAAEVVQDGITGLHFRPTDAQDLAAKVMMLNSNPAMRTRIGSTGRKEFETRYTAEVNYSLLMNIYDRTVTEHRCA